MHFGVVITVSSEQRGLPAAQPCIVEFVILAQPTRLTCLWQAMHVVTQYEGIRGFTYTML